MPTDREQTPPRFPQVGTSPAPGIPGSQAQCCLHLRLITHGRERERRMAPPCCVGEQPVHPCRGHPAAPAGRPSLSGGLQTRPRDRTLSPGRPQSAHSRWWGCQPGCGVMRWERGDGVGRDGSVACVPQHSEPYRRGLCGTRGAEGSSLTGERLPWLPLQSEPLLLFSPSLTTDCAEVVVFQQQILHFTEMQLVQTPQWMSEECLEAI